MTTDDAEGMDFLAAFTEKFGANPERTKARRKAERRANLTPKQRARTKGLPKKQKNFRASAETLAQLKSLVSHLGKSETDVIAEAISDLSSKHNVGARKR